MKNEDRKLIRTFYQSLVTPEERDLFYKILLMSKRDRVSFMKTGVFQDLAEKYGFNDELYNAVLIAATMTTREDLIYIAASKVRVAVDNILVKFFRWLGGLFK